VLLVVIVLVLEVVIAVVVDDPFVEVTKKYLI
jgi:hypothetical protein